MDKIVLRFAHFFCFAAVSLVSASKMATSSSLLYMTLRGGMLQVLSLPKLPNLSSLLTLRDPMN